MIQTFKIGLLEGDGIGPEVVAEGMKILSALTEKTGVNFHFAKYFFGGAAVDFCGNSYPIDTTRNCRTCDAILLGAVGGPKWAKEKDPERRPETALLKVRKELNLFANLRPASLRASLVDACPLKEEVAQKGFDIMIVRELTSGIYFGERNRYENEEGVTVATDILAYTEPEIEQICRTAFKLAMRRGKKVSSVDKANVLESSRLWRETFHRIAEEFPEVEIEDVLVDNAAMQLIRDPAQFDVMVTENMFGDILSDEASMLTGSIGLLPSASINDGTLFLYEPIHGSAPDIAGQNKANPIATILSVAMMVRYSFAMDNAADCIEKAVDAVLEEGYRTPDIYTEGSKLVGTVEMGDLIAAKLQTMPLAYGGMG